MREAGTDGQFKLYHLMGQTVPVGGKVYQYPQADSASSAFFPVGKSAMKRKNRRPYANLTLSFAQFFPGISHQR